MVNRRLAWGYTLMGCLNGAMDGGVTSVSVEPTVDPLLKNMVFVLRERFSSKACWNAFQTLVHSYARANDCSVSTIKKTGSSTYKAAVLIKHRNGPKMENDPFLMDDWKSGRQLRREQYMKMLRDKNVDTKEGLTK